MQFEQGSTGGNQELSPNHGGHLPNAGTPVTRRSPESSLHGEALQHDPQPSRADGWAAQFDPSYDVPAEILALVKSGEVDDLSWHNDACPSFGLHHPGDDLEVKIWVEHPVLSEREGIQGHRFLVWSADAGDLLDTDDVNDAIRALREALIGFPREVDGPEHDDGPANGDPSCVHDYPPVEDLETMQPRLCVKCGADGDA